MNVLVTGANGFIGSNLCVALRRRSNAKLIPIDIESTPDQMERALEQADVMFHLAGVNRPKDEAEFHEVNAVLTEALCARLIALGRAPKLILASSVQAECDNPYGHSKLQAEQALEQYAKKSGATVVVYRLKNLFGKWCRPNYNSVTATFCNNIARGLPIEISDPSRLLSLTYIDDVVAAFISELDTSDIGGFRRAAALASTDITLGGLATLVGSFRAHRESLFLPDFSEHFVRALYATYLSYLEPESFAYWLSPREDSRGSLADSSNSQLSASYLFLGRSPASRVAITTIAPKLRSSLLSRGRQ